jgi:hypothetical protein
MQQHVLLLLSIILLVSLSVVSAQQGQNGRHREGKWITEGDGKIIPIDIKRGRHFPRDLRGADIELLRQVNYNTTHGHRVHHDRGNHKRAPGSRALTPAIANKLYNVPGGMNAGAGKVICRMDVASFF